MTIRVTNLSYHYRNQRERTLDGLSTEFKPGEVTLIAGASGCGKTTLIRCINGLIPRSYTGGELSGAIELFGQDTAALTLATISQIIGTVLQDPEKQIVASDVTSEIAFGLENLGLPRDEIRERIAHTAELLHISNLLTRETFLLSGGEKQKVALAGVLAMRPRAVLLDEPLASLIARVPSGTPRGCRTRCAGSPKGGRFPSSSPQTPKAISQKVSFAVAPRDGWL